MTGEDYFAMVEFIQNKIKESFDIDLEPEVRLLSNGSKELKK